MLKGLLPDGFFCIILHKGFLYTINCSTWVTNKLRKPEGTIVVVHYIDNICKQGYQKLKVQSSQVTKSNDKIVLCKMTSHFELLTQKFVIEFFFRVSNSTS